MSDANSYILWEDEDFVVQTPENPHIPYLEGPHVIVAPKQAAVSAWANPGLAGETFKLAAKACAVMEDLELAPWFNLQANGNWGLLSGRSPFFHIHIYGRNKTKSWGKPIVLPEAPGTYRNDPMPKDDREKLKQAFDLGL